MVMCGCNYQYENGVGFCGNSYPDCPALTDAGQNFGVCPFDIINIITK